MFRKLHQCPKTVEIESGTNWTEAALCSIPQLSCEALKRDKDPGLKHEMLILMEKEHRIGPK